MRAARGAFLGCACLDRVVVGVAAPLVPASVVDGGSGPAHELSVEPCLACTPAGSAVEGDPFVGCDVGLCPVGGDFRVWPHRVVEVAVVLHVVGVAAAVSPDVACDADRKSTRLNSVTPIDR